ncbi:Late embryogenesis abundant protein-related [Heracleum sosnowskyi]|uniref:Late embryogenesis abundant protein-related n=1 Tax=Heracleum sosnowskyi TaxID=360622 RepID=A0AAD8J6E4_9APIA|nr:Late embryogenesis abundant protein-related [Heracleum sosnowskyi]
MKIFNNSVLAIIVFIVCSAIQIHAQTPQRSTCFSRASACFLRRITCPTQCPTFRPSNPKDKACFINCDSPLCSAECKNRKPNCNGNGAACYDPRFIGGDGIVFYFHGRSNEHFSLVSDHNLQINARFIGLRPAGRTRDYTWIQALGVQFGSQKFSIEATKAALWDDNIDHLKFLYNEEDVILEETPLSVWESAEGNIKAERISGRNDVIVSISNFVEISVRVVPVTKEDNRVHNYQTPSGDCFAHLEVQFRFFSLSPEVEGVLGRTYRPDFENPAKPGVAMPVVGGEDKYKISSLLSSDCRKCIFSPTKDATEKGTMDLEYGTLDCTSGQSKGNGIVCKK